MKEVYNSDGKVVRIRPITSIIQELNELAKEMERAAMLRRKWGAMYLEEEKEKRS